MPLKPPTSIAILGSGISGTLLRTCLSKKGILSGFSSLKMYDRAPTRHAGGPVQLHPWGIEPLVKFLGVDHKRFQKEVSMTLSPGKEVDVEGDDKEQQGKGSFWVDRDKLDGFCKSLVSEWEGKEFEVLQGINRGVDISEDNEREIDITIESKEKSKEDRIVLSTGGVLVGAEGVHSVTRQYLSPESKLKVLPYAVYNGRRDLTFKEYNEKYHAALGENTLVEKRIGKTFFQVKVLPGRKELELNYTFSRPARSNSTTNDGDPLFRPGREKDEATSIPPEIFEEVAQIRSQNDLETPFGEAFDPERMKKDRILNWLMRCHMVERNDLDEMARKGVVLIGEAAYSTPILGSVGANDAILDAICLAEVLADGRDLRELYEKRYGAWKKVVEDSEKRIGEMHQSKETRL